MCQKQLLLEHLGTVSRLHGNQRFANARAKSLLEQLSALLRVSCRTCQQGLDIALSQAVMLRKRRIQMRSSAVHNLRIPIRTAPELALPGGLWPGGLGQECFLERTQRLSGSCPTMQYAAQCRENAPGSTGGVPYRKIPALLTESVINTIRSNCHI